MATKAHTTMNATTTHAPYKKMIPTASPIVRIPPKLMVLDVVTSNMMVVSGSDSLKHPVPLVLGHLIDSWDRAAPKFLSDKHFHLTHSFDTEEANIVVR